MKQKRRRYSGALKAKVGLEALMGVKTTSQIAREHQVHPRPDTDGWNEGLPYLIKPVSDEKVAEMIRRHARKAG